MTVLMRDPLEVTCPHCRARPGKPCREPAWAQAGKRKSHPSRKKRAAANRPHDIGGYKPKRQQGQWSQERYAAQQRALLPKREPERGSRSRYTTFDDGERVSVKARPVGVETSRRRH